MQSYVQSVVHFYERIGDEMRRLWHADRLTFAVGFPAVLFFSYVLLPMMLRPAIPFIATFFIMQMVWWPAFMIFLFKEMGWDK